ncbi:MULTISPECIES: hypothetical protein [unclassified Streptomyces]|uniref:hypothetical protein n=1 Tax=unclassified Streptomyces TaxID=2593676 RepID=UPI000B1BE1FB|nr:MULTISPECIES: hypothetical protein [unclassified Streptomyces]
MRPVLESYTPDGFDLWPVVEGEPFRLLPLSGALGPVEVGTALMNIARCNDIDPEHDARPPRPAEPLGAFLHGLLTFDTLFAAGGMEVVDDSTGTAFRPGCCTGLEDWRDWYEVVDGGGGASFGHDPDAFAERLGETVRLTVDAEQHGSAVIELPVTDMRRLLAGAERDLVGFHALAADWAAEHLPLGHAGPVTAAVARVLDLRLPPYGLYAR